MKFLILLFIFSTHAFSAQWSQVDKILSDGLKSKLYPGASLYVGDENLALYQHSVGDSDEAKIYDIASLTKVVATTLSIMILEETGELSLNDKVHTFIPEFTSGSKSTVTIEDLMRHRAGLAAGARPLENESLEGYIKRIASKPLSYRPRTKTVYSDLSFIFLGRIVELVGGKKLSEFAEGKIFKPLRMNNTSFGVSSTNSDRCAPTSSQADCLVHDPTAHALLPDSVGNAGVFSNLEDLSRLGRMLINRGELEGVRVLSEATIKKMLSTDGKRGLGWDFSSEYSTAPRGEVFPAGISFGHTGYTGTTMWVDPKSETFYVFLSNRVYMGDERTKKPFTAFRKKLSTAIGKKIYGLLEKP